MIVTSLTTAFQSWTTLSGCWQRFTAAVWETSGFVASCFFRCGKAAIFDTSSGCLAFFRHRHRIRSLAHALRGSDLSAILSEWRRVRKCNCTACKEWLALAGLVPQDAVSAECVSSWLRSTPQDFQHACGDLSPVLILAMPQIAVQPRRATMKISVWFDAKGLDALVRVVPRSGSAQVAALELDLRCSWCSNC